METPLPPHVAKAVRGPRQQKAFAKALGISLRTLQRIEDGIADAGRLTLYANAYLGWATRRGPFRLMAYLLDSTGENQLRGRLLPEWRHAKEGQSW